MLYSAVTYNVGPTGTNFSLFISLPTLSLSSTTFPIGRGTEQTLQRARRAAAQPEPPLLSPRQPRAPLLLLAPLP